jgi:hypothetical protein
MQKHCPYFITLFALVSALCAQGEERPRLGPGPGISTPWSEGDTFESPEENQAPQFVPEESSAIDASPLAKQLSFPPIFGEPGYTPMNERPKMPLVFFFSSRALGKVSLKGKRAVAVVTTSEEEAPSFLPSIGAEPAPPAPPVPSATAAKQEADVEVEPQSPGDITRDRSLISQIETEEARRQATARRSGENGTSRRLLQNLKAKSATASH